jgi:methyltransferase
VIEELKNIEEKYIYFCEAHSFQDINYMRDLASAIEKNQISKIYTMYIRVDAVEKSFELLKKWRDLGLRRVFIGFEAVENNKLNAFNKGTKTITNEKAIHLLHEIGVEVIGSFIIALDFLPNNFYAIKDWVNKMHLTLPVFNILTPLPGTQLYNENYALLQKAPFEHFDFYHALLPTKMPLKDFYKHVANLYRETYNQPLPPDIMNKFDLDDSGIQSRKKVGELLAKMVESNARD